MKVAFVVCLIGIIILLFVFDSIYFLPLLFIEYLIYCGMADEKSDQKQDKKKG